MVATKATGVIAVMMDANIGLSLLDEFIRLGLECKDQFAQVLEESV